MEIYHSTKKIEGASVNLFSDTLNLVEVVLQELVLGARSTKKRSLLRVNEHFEYEITLLDGFKICTYS